MMAPEMYLQYGIGGAAVLLMWHLAHQCMSKSRDVIEANTQALQELKAAIKGTKE